MEQRTIRPALPRRLVGALCVCVLATLASVTATGTAHAQASAPDLNNSAPAQNSAAAPRSVPCSDAYQIGRTGYIRYGNMIAASVKQYYSPSCQKNWGYVWVWESFRDRRIPYDVGVAVYSYTTGQQYGNQYSPRTRKAAFWSSAASTVPQCTAGYGYLLINNTVSAEEYSSKRC